MSVIYRLWAAVRLYDLVRWQAQWLPNCQHSFKPGHAVEDVYWTTALRIEHSILTQTPLFGINFDYSLTKCFDQIPHLVVLRLVEEMGLSQEVMDPLCAMYGGQQRRFRCGAGLVLVDQWHFTGMSFVCNLGECINIHLGCCGGWGGREC
eukprot:12102584-Karenia_brevis.AAC.1